MISDYLRNKLSQYFTGQKKLVLRDRVPSGARISHNLHGLENIGLYLHIPFCDRICPYCPYNKQLFREDECRAYVKAICDEVDVYAPLLNGLPVNSFYIGGGTPTTMLGRGIEKIVAHIYDTLNMQCHIHMESHPNHLSEKNLDSLQDMGVEYLSVGVEALQDHHLKAIHRPYTVEEVKTRIKRAAKRDFKCLNIDYIFDLPDQSDREIREAAETMVNLGVDQVATYPLFRFTYTGLGHKFHQKRHALGTMLRRRRMLKILEETFYESGFERSSVWAFTKKGVNKYCSVTVPSYIGLGASGGSYLRDLFYVNTFSVPEYIEGMKSRRSAITLSLDLTEKMQMAAWLYWRIYETQFVKSDFRKRFNKGFDKIYGHYMNLLNMIGYIKNGQDQIQLTDKGTYWIHAFEDFFSIDYINKLWGTSKNEAWPGHVTL